MDRAEGSRTIPGSVARRKKLKYCTSRGDLISRGNNDYFFPFKLKKGKKIINGRNSTRPHPEPQNHPGVDPYMMRIL